MPPDLRRRFEELLLALPEWRREGSRTALLGVLREHEIWDDVDPAGSPATAAVSLLNLSAKHGSEPFCRLLRKLSGDYQDHPELYKEIDALETALRNVRAHLLHAEWKEGPPYRGLAYFDRRHAPIFFGREHEVEALIQKLTTTEQGRRFTAVVGASGSGKSSLVRAGLWARLHDGRVPELPGSERWLVSAMSPLAMGDPAASLQAALNHSLDESDRFEDKRGLQIGQTPFAELAEQLLPPGNVRWLLILDQMEELFALNADGAAFLDRLLDATRPDSSSRFQVVATLRADFFHYCLDYEQLKRAVSRDGGQFLLSRPGRLSLERMISGPVTEVNLASRWSLDPALPPAMATDAELHPGGLALMAFALRELYDICREKRRLDFGTYRSEAFGGLSGAIARRADATLAKLGENAGAVLERVFARLVRVNQDDAPTRRRAHRSAWNDDPEARDLIAAFLKARLLVADSDNANAADPVIEVAHEALLREWPRLARWIDEQRDAFLLSDRVRADAKAWIEGPQGGHLQRPWRDNRIDEARERLAKAGLLRQLLQDRGVARFLTPEVEWILEELQHAGTKHTRRRDIGQRLAEIGDPRQGVGVRDGVPDLLWRHITSAGEVEIEGHGLFPVQPFHMAAFPITFSQFQSFLDAKDGYEDRRWWKDLNRENPAAGWTSPLVNHPVTYVSWYDATAFCRWLTWVLGYEVRLPDEQEWQWAAQSMRPEYRFPWGPEWCPGLANTTESDLNHTTAVGMYPDGDSLQQISDLSGNVWEWCVDEHSDPDRTLAGGTEARVLRGGSWNFNLVNARADYRYIIHPINRYYFVGFRVVCSSPIR